MRRLIRLAAWLLLVGVVAVPSGAAATSIDTRAQQAILIDTTTDTVLFEKNADERMATASMSKVMTMFLVFDALREGRLSLDDRLPVSERAWRKGGSKMFVEVGDTVSVEDLTRGVIVQSGNDASIVLAEGLAGSETEFGRRMTERARELGMTASNFTNATGWPDPQHFSTARDLATLAEALIREFPEYYHYYSEKEFTYGTDVTTGRPITQRNRNPLLYRDIGADGLKTGHTEASGYGLMASAERDGRRLVLVINGLPSESARAEEANRLMEWGFREFEVVPLFEAGELVETAEAWLGSPSAVPLVPAQAVAVTVPFAEREAMSVAVRVEEPLPAPIAAGEPVATLVVAIAGSPVRQLPLVAGAEVRRQGFLGRVTSSAGHMILRLFQ